VCGFVLGVILWCGCYLFGMNECACVVRVFVSFVLTVCVCKIYC